MGNIYSTHTHTQFACSPVSRKHTHVNILSHTNIVVATNTRRAVEMTGVGRLTACQGTT